MGDRTESRLKVADWNVFVNTGVGIDYFAGSGFDNFYKFPWRSRVGLGFRNVQAGVQLDYFVNRFNPEDFNAVGEAREGGEWVVGFFLGFDLFDLCQCSR